MDPFEMMKNSQEIEDEEYTDSRDKEEGTIEVEDEYGDEKSDDEDEEDEEKESHQKKKKQKKHVSKDKNKSKERSRDKKKASKKDSKKESKKMSAAKVPKSSSRSKKGEPLKKLTKALESDKEDFD